MVFNYRIQLMKVLVFIRLYNTPPRVKIYLIEPNVFIVYPKRGIACLVNAFEHEQIPL
jgi:hypothetical protein